MMARSRAYRGGEGDERASRPPPYSGQPTPLRGESVPRLPCGGPLDRPRSRARRGLHELADAVRGRHEAAAIPAHRGVRAAQVLQSRSARVSAQFQQRLGHSTMWGFGDHGNKSLTTTPGPLIRAKYGEPVLVRFNNQLPDEPCRFRHRRAHDPSAQRPHPFESDGNPVNYSFLPRPIAQDQHYPNVYAGFGDGRGESAGLAVVPRPPPRFHRPERLQGHVRLLQPVRRSSTRGGRAKHRPATAGGDYDIPIFFHDALFDQQLPAGVRPVQPGRHPGRQVPRQRRDPALPERRRSAATGSGIYAPGPSRWWEWSLWDGTKFLPFWQISHRRQPAAERRAGDQRAYRRGRAGRHHRRLQQDHGARASTSSTVRSRSTAAARPARS